MLPTGGADVRHTRDVAGALRMARTWRPDLILLDLDHAGVSLGVSACRMVRTTIELARTLILVVSDDAGEDLQLALLDAGADDYVERARIVRPSFRARVAALLRRTSPGPLDAKLACGPLMLDAGRHEASLDSSWLELTRAEFRILWRLGRRAGCTVSRADLFEGLQNVVPRRSSRAVDMHIRQIRRKLGAASALLRTDYGKGYRLEAGVPAPPVRRDVRRAG